MSRKLSSYPGGFLWKPLKKDCRVCSGAEWRDNVSVGKPAALVEDAMRAEREVEELFGDLYHFGVERPDWLGGVVEGVCSLYLAVSRCPHGGLQFE